MSDDLDLTYYENRLRERLAALIEGGEDRKNDTAPVELDPSRVGRLSRMDAMQSQAMSQAAARLSTIEQQRIASAIERIRSGDYGYCILCEEEIPERRLQIDPSTPTCIACAQRAESK